jgi:exopolyphosphatase/pppGpp-phosphohydrolase
LQEKYPDVVSEIDSDLRVLSSAEEAECSFIAGVAYGAVEAPGGLQYVVIDMGSGSIEVIAGRIRQSVPTITDHVSCALGSRRISKQLQDADHNPEAFDSWLEERLDEVEIPKPGVGAKTILLGSVPTKAVWLQVRPSPFDNYDPQLVGGASIERDAADKLGREILIAWRKDAATARKFVDPKIKDDSEIDLLVSGLRLLNKILVRQQRRNCVVSSRGTLLGFAFKSANSQ